jgi:hypothetical protein
MADPRTPTSYLAHATLALGILASLATACGGTEDGARPAGASAAATASRSFSCTQTTSGRAAYRQAVAGSLDSAGVPHGVVVTRVATGVVEISSANPVLEPSFDGGYWKQTYGIDAWGLGTVTVGYPSKTYTFLFPPNPAAAFTALLKTDFGPNGSQGNWQHWMACTLN